MCARECWGRGSEGPMMHYSWEEWVVRVGVLGRMGLVAREVDVGDMMVGWAREYRSAALWLQKFARSQQET